MMTAPGTKVYVSWYGRTLEGEVVDGDGFMGMTPVRIPLDGHHPVALFFPLHVYSSPELLTEISKDQSKVAENLTEISDEQSKVADPVQQFKESHWDEAHNHLRVNCLDEFYQLWLQTHAAVNLMLRLRLLFRHLSQSLYLCSLYHKTAHLQSDYIIKSLQRH